MGFFDTLRAAPNPFQAYAPGMRGIYVCPIRGTSPSPSALDYREPGPGLPGGRVSDELTQPCWPIACDRCDNHARSGYDDLNVLFFSCSVGTVGKGSPEWDMAMQYTTDPK